MMVINEVVKAEAGRVVAYAHEHPLDSRTIFHTLAHPDEAAGNQPGHRFNIPMGFKVVFTVEQQPQGWMRHMSMSVAAAGKYPAVVAVMQAMALCGFQRTMQECLVYKEDEVQAVNVLEPYPEFKP